MPKPTFSATCLAIALLAISLALPASASGKRPNTKVVETEAAHDAIQYRKALMQVMGMNFMPVGEMLQGHIAYNAAEATRRAERVAFIARMLGEAFPDVSRVGNTNAKPEIWTNRADFNKHLQALVDSTAALSAQLQKAPADAAAFKKAAGAAGQACKDCHDRYEYDEE
jgi:cytochrome c556